MSNKPRSIAEYLRDRRKKSCPVCKVPEPIRAQMNTARQRSKVHVADILEWLKSEYGIAITREQFRQHYGGMHEGSATTRVR